MSPKLKKIFISTAFILPIFFVALYITGSNSDAYKEALNYIQKNTAVNEKIGVNADLSLAYFGYSIKTSGVSGSAEFEVKANGKIGKGSIFVSLNKNIGIWSVIKSNLVLESGAILKNI